MMRSVTTIQTREAANLADMIQENMHPYHKLAQPRLQMSYLKYLHVQLNMLTIYRLNNIKLTFRHSHSAINQRKNGGKMGKRKKKL